MRSVLLVSICACLGGCAVGPDYKPPRTDVAAQFANAGLGGFTEADVQADFWTVFNEPLLNDLVEAALDANKDLAQARANLRASRAARRVVGFDSYPTITAGGARFHRLQSENQLPGFTRNEREGDDVEAGFDAAWELDFFGRVRRGREAARAEEQAAASQVRNAQVTVTGEVARNYFVLRGLQEQLTVAIRNADNQRQTLGLTQARLDAGRGTELDRSRAEAQLKTTLAGIPPLQASLATTTYRLSVLTGRPARRAVISTGDATTSSRPAAAQRHRQPRCPPPPSP